MTMKLDSAGTRKRYFVQYGTYSYGNGSYLRVQVLPEMSPCTLGTVAHTKKGGRVRVALGVRLPSDSRGAPTYNLLTPFLSSCSYS
ncbi:hypothetical protein EAG_14360 [Camponotus floridanus]|uniref:Uncharacterized protein n=1 Tax=Camponotus floridanus TaxID=104421 RepID=E2A305_CAMFO|nr:hypothetical protein EAG_14360 [Camponotus floridanus]